MIYSFDDSKAEDRHKTQYFELFGNRGIYFDGWFAGTVHMKPCAKPETRFTEDTWKLYHVAEDFSMSTDLAKQHPDILIKLQQAFLGEAVKYKVLPLEDRREELFNPKLAGRPDLMFGRKSLTLYEGMNGLLKMTSLRSRTRRLKLLPRLRAETSRPTVSSSLKADVSVDGRCT